MRCGGPRARRVARGRRGVSGGGGTCSCVALVARNVDEKGGRASGAGLVRDVGVGVEALVPGRLGVLLAPSWGRRGGRWWSRHHGASVATRLPRSASTSPGEDRRGHQDRRHDALSFWLNNGMTSAVGTWPRALGGLDNPHRVRQGLVVARLVRHDGLAGEVVGVVAGSPANPVSVIQQGGLASDVEHRVHQGAERAAAEGPWPPGGRAWPRRWPCGRCSSRR